MEELKALLWEKKKLCMVNGFKYMNEWETRAQASSYGVRVIEG